VLLYQLHGAARVSRAIVAVHVIRRARDYLSLAISVVTAIPVTVVIAVTITVVVPISVPTATFFDREISPAAVIHPDASVIRSPTVAFRTGGLATLFH
jgi:hypothetical protein